MRTYPLRELEMMLLRDGFVSCVHNLKKTYFT